MGRAATIVVLACLGSLIALAGVRDALVERGWADLLLEVVIACGVTMACVHDARRIGRPMPCAATMAILFAWPVAIPVYLVWTRTWKRGGLAALAFLGAAVTLFLVPFYAAGYAVWGLPAG